MELPSRIEARGLPVRFHPRALEEMYKEGFTEEDVADALDSPAQDKQGTVLARKRGKTLIVRYRERGSYLLVHGFSATTRRLGSL